jgi:uncharacterized protein YdaU (DUF1376 family)
MPYMKWYVNDHRANRKVQNLGYIAEGLFRQLLDEIWLEGWIPDDLPRLAEICRCPISVMAKQWPKLKPMFTPIDGLDGQLLTNRRLDAERSEQDRKRAMRAAFGRLGGVAKAFRTTDMLANAGKSQTESGKSHIAEQSRGEQSGAGTSSHKKEEVPAPSRAEAGRRSSPAAAPVGAQPPPIGPGTATENDRTADLLAPYVSRVGRLTAETAGVDPPRGTRSNPS